jgi:hypothetical protein
LRIIVIRFFVTGVINSSCVVRVPGSIRDGCGGGGGGGGSGSGSGGSGSGASSMAAAAAMAAAEAAEAAAETAAVAKATFRYSTRFHYSPVPSMVATGDFLSCRTSDVDKTPLFISYASVADLAPDHPGRRCFFAYPPLRHPCATAVAFSVPAPWPPLLLRIVSTAAALLPPPYRVSFPPPYSPPPSSIMRSLSSRLLLLCPAAV